MTDQKKPFQQQSFTDAGFPRTALDAAKTAMKSNDTVSLLATLRATGVIGEAEQRQAFVSKGFLCQLRSDRTARLEVLDND